MSAANAVQTAIYQALTASAPLMVLVKGIFDNVPQLDEREDPDARFPFVVIGDDDVNEDDTDTSRGFLVEVEIHAWSRKRGRKEIKEIQGLVYEALHRQTLNVAGYHFVDCFFDESETKLDPDGKTRHGISIFRISITELGV